MWKNSKEHLDPPKKPHPEVFQWPHMVTVFSGAGRPMLLTVLWSRATTQPCGGTFFEACPNRAGRKCLDGGRRNRPDGSVGHSLNVQSI